MFAVSHYVTLTVEHDVTLVEEQNEICNTHTISHDIPTLICDNQATAVNLSDLHSNNYILFVNNTLLVCIRFAYNNYTFCFEYHNLHISVPILHLLLVQVPHQNFQTFFSNINKIQPQSLKEYLHRYSWKENQYCDSNLHLWSSHQR
jgi:hypothetical protein